MGVRPAPVSGAWAHSAPPLGASHARGASVVDACAARRSVSPEGCTRTSVLAGSGTQGSVGQSHRGDSATAAAYSEAPGQQGSDPEHPPLRLRSSPQVHRAPEGQHVTTKARSLCFPHPAAVTRSVP